MSNMLTFYATVKWRDVAEQPSGFDELPRAFEVSKGLWHEDADGNLERIIELLSPFVSAHFTPTNISGWQDLFVNGDGNEMIEIESTDVRVVGIVLPRISSGIETGGFVRDLLLIMLPRSSCDPIAPWLASPSSATGGSASLRHVRKRLAA